MDTNAADKPVPREIGALLSNKRLILRRTERAVAPFGGLAVFISFLRKVGFVEKVRQHMPIRWRSPNHIDPTATFTAFLIAVLTGAKRSAHAGPLHGDRALHALLGLDRFPPPPARRAYLHDQWVLSETLSLSLRQQSRIPPNSSLRH